MSTKRIALRGGWIFPVVFLAAVATVVGFVTARWIRPRVDAAETGALHGPPAASPVDSGNTLDVSLQGQKNIGLQSIDVAVGDFAQTVTIPGRVVERPGHSRITVSTPLTGIVERILPLEGEAVQPGEPIAVLRLTHQEVIRLQTELLDIIQRREIVAREVARLEKVAASGAVAGKTLLQAQYEEENLRAEIDAKRAGLLLLGLTEEQLTRIFDQRVLVSRLTLLAPLEQTASAGCTGAHLYQTAKISASVGQQVDSGTSVCELTDYCRLLIEGQAFEQDAATLEDALRERLPVSAVVEGHEEPITVEGLRILFLDTEVDTESRALRFYVDIANTVVHQTEDDEGRPFIGWKFRPGQRVELRVPVETWKNRIVLPAEAVVQDGAESIVFVKQGNAFTRKAVVEVYRDATRVVLASDGTLFPGDRVVTRGAYPLYLMFKNRTGGAIDPHAGHNH